MRAAMNVYDEFDWRGLIYHATDGLRDVLGGAKVTVYIGFDPSAASLHVGSLLPVMALARLQRFGHTPVAIVGGGTGLIGDPSGKTLERLLLTREQVEENLRGIKEQLSRFLDFGAAANPAATLNNADWLSTIPLMDFLRDVGKHFTVNYMLGKESVSRRLEQEQGISFTEFSYMLLQAYDFLVLNERHGCTVQMGGSDQWGNILAGVELIRRLGRGKAHGLVFPLVTTSSGVKFGKTEAGAVWLDAERTSPFRFYQFWLNTDDRDAIPYLKFFTWLSEERIAALAAELAAAPERRAAQRTLAREVTLLVHGETALAKAEQASRVLFGAEITQLRAEEILDIFADVPSTQIPKAALAGDGLPLAELLVTSGLASSKGDARRLIQGGGIYLNNRRVPPDPPPRIPLTAAIDARLLVLRKGARQYHVIQLAD
ncbi:MAG TPA: tyrosine--tRNA ligase [Pyrinomonadaceae bacterium]|jgi:tyrosyl-tRNA synthetase